MVDDAETDQALRSKRHDALQLHRLSRYELKRQMTMLALLGRTDQRTPTGRPIRPYLTSRDHVIFLKTKTDQPF